LTKITGLNQFSLAVGHRTTAKVKDWCTQSSRLHNKIKPQCITYQYNLSLTNSWTKDSINKIIPSPRNRRWYILALELHVYMIHMYIHLILSSPMNSYCINHIYVCNGTLYVDIWKQQMYVLINSITFFLLHINTIKLVLCDLPKEQWNMVT
jgi:hypothetical protein